MIKYLLITMCLLAFLSANAQNGGLVYYLKNNGKLVSTKDSADYSMVVLPPDTSVDKTLYVVYEYYKNGKVKLVTNSKTNDINIRYFGNFISYFPSGKKKLVGRFDDGKITGRLTKYYPNGKMYSIQNHTDKDVLSIECRDSTGSVLAENGKGKWVQYDNDNFTEIQSQGKIKNGLRDGQWTGLINIKYDLGRIVSYTNGERRSSSYLDFPTIEKYPEFPGGAEALGRFINSNINYPDIAKQKGTEGVVQVRFVVKRDGSLSDISIAKGLENGCDQEAIRIVKLLPNWNPGVINKREASIPDSISVYFSLTNSCVNAEIGSAKYFLRNSGYRVSRRDSADYFLAITPNDTPGHKYRFIAKAFYNNGQTEFVSATNTDELRVKNDDNKGFFEPVLQGAFISFFSNGLKKSVETYKNGDLIGEETAYYHNSKIYTIKIHATDKKIFYKECRDSIGNVLVENGNGKGMEFTDESFKNYVRGEVINGLQEGEWFGKDADTANIVWDYNKGNLLTTAILEGSGNKLYTKAEVDPEFAGGMQAFGMFLNHNIRYPPIAREQGIQGRILIKFIIENDGKIIDVKIAKGIGGGCDEEGVRVMKLSPPWSPGLVNGKPVKTQYIIPLGYFLSEE